MPRGGRGPPLSRSRAPGVSSAHSACAVLPWARRPPGICPLARPGQPAGAPLLPRCAQPQGPAPLPFPPGWRPEAAGRRGWPRTLGRRRRKRLLGLHLSEAGSSGRSLAPWLRCRASLLRRGDQRLSPGLQRAQLLAALRPARRLLPAQLLPDPLSLSMAQRGGPSCRSPADGSAPGGGCSA